MRRKSSTALRVFLSVVVLGLFLGPILSVSVFAQEKSSEDRLKVGVVDVREVYRSYKRTAKFSKNFVKKKKQAEKKIKSLSKKLKKIKEEMEQLEPLSDLWKKRAEKYYQLESKQKLMKDLWKKDTKKLLGKTTVEIYDTIRKVIREYAREHNFDLILKVNQSDIKSKKMERVNDQIASRSVLYFRKKMNVTDKIIEIVNKRYREKKNGDDSTSSATGE